MDGIRKWFDNQTSFSMVGANNNQARLVESDLLHTEKILSDRKTFFLDLKQNSRGMVVKITEDVGGNRDTIMVPAEILGDFIAALSDIKSTADEHQ
jgi:PurA ssDNA and RNA-binding protein